MAVTTTLLDRFKRECKNWIKNQSGVANPTYIVLEKNDETFIAIPATPYKDSDEDPIYTQFRGIHTNYADANQTFDLIYITGNQSDWKPATIAEVQNKYNDGVTVPENISFVKIELTGDDIKTVEPDQPYAILIKFSC